MQNDTEAKVEIPPPLPGHPGNVSKEQESKLDTLRTELRAAGYTERTDDVTLLRYLRARNFNVQKTYDMFTTAEKWRLENNVEEIKRSFVFHEKREIMKYYPRYYHKQDKLGQPIYFEQLGMIDLNAMYKITTQERLLQAMVYEAEKLQDIRFPACTLKENRMIETSCTILDLKSLPIRQLLTLYSYLQEASKIGELIYPERMGKFFIINCPAGFSLVWSLAKRFLDPVTVEKIVVLGKDYQGVLKECIDEENLPREFGGLCECEGGCMFSDAGPWNEMTDEKEG